MGMTNEQPNIAHRHTLLFTPKTPNSIRYISSASARFRVYSPPPLAVYAATTPCRLLPCRRFKLSASRPVAARRNNASVANPDILHPAKRQGDIQLWREAICHKGNRARI